MKTHFLHYTFSFRNEIEKKDWDDFIDNSDEAWLWHRYDLIDALSTWRGRSDLSFVLFDSNFGKDIIAAVPLYLISGFLKGVIPWKQLESTGAAAFHNCLSPKKKKEGFKAIRHYLIELAQKNKAVSVELSCSPMAPAYRKEYFPRVNPLLMMGCENSLTQTYILDLQQGINSIWSNMETRARTAVKKGEKLGVKVRESTHTDEALDLYYALHCETYQRTGARPHPKAYFESIWKNFLVKGYSLIFFAEKDGEVIAAENFGIYKNAGIYWTGAANQQGLAMSANSVLQWHAIQWMISHQIQFYEIGEAFPNVLEGKQKGLSDFKKSFGGDLYPYYRGRITISPLFTLHQLTETLLKNKNITKL